ncbi:hypothetical protein ISN45_At05g059920 [Arabidopsis thaliana x Arabidopsis arenosa]|uniref:RBR-type E3 ubiquitin transferase n=1 Tax=Arabidopsis thaliana x Arabidopsis arenosa TaxID=1240361 RepID=A0A8T2D816_9BRAS|nr:hypothetical protein ISN45_At05g059920 [Arabidopsis thaliana x Arabidopsis arenosa]
MENDQQGSYLRDEDKEEMEKRIRTVVIDSNLVLSNSTCGICRTAEDEYIKVYDDHNNDGDGDGDGDEDADADADEDEDEAEDEDADEDEYEDEDDDDEDDDDADDADDDEDDDDEDDDEDDDDDDDDDDENDEECDDEYDSHRLISTPYCTHKFCKTCWREYLETNFYSLEENLTVISCPDQDCGASVRLKTIEKLGVHDQDMYLSYIMRVYIENESKQLPAPDDN